MHALNSKESAKICTIKNFPKFLKQLSIFFVFLLVTVLVKNQHYRLHDILGRAGGITLVEVYPLHRVCFLNLSHKKNYSNFLKQLPVLFYFITLNGTEYNSALALLWKHIRAIGFIKQTSSIVVALYFVDIQSLKQVTKFTQLLLLVSMSLAQVCNLCTTLLIFECILFSYS